MAKLVYTTAIVVIPPQDAWPAIQAIRRKHDAKIHRWMPHITLVYPCLPVADFPAAQGHLVAACRDIPAFEVELAEFRTFRLRRGNHTIWLAPEPESDLIELQAVVQRAVIGEELVGSRPARFRPHLSVGQVNGNAEMLRLVEGTTFSFSLHDPREDEFPYSIRFSLGQWSATTIRAAGARRIARFLAVFNDDPTLDWRDCRNRDGRGASATTAKYLVHLMRKACEPTG